MLFVNLSFSGTTYSLGWNDQWMTERCWWKTVVHRCSEDQITPHGILTRLRSPTSSSHALPSSQAFQFASSKAVVMWGDDRIFHKSAWNALNNEQGCWAASADFSDWHPLAWWKIERITVWNLVNSNLKKNTTNEKLENLALKTLNNTTQFNSWKPWLASSTAECTKHCS